MLDVNTNLTLRLSINVKGHEITDNLNWNEHTFGIQESICYLLFR